ncbi:hypothetical protein Bbelb_116290 [Branchiostoma belcheri]|nr:hypothetical protein Bbelb_116290 [Branchiostoma belcheri]
MSCGPHIARKSIGRRVGELYTACEARGIAWKHIYDNEAPVTLHAVEKPAQSPREGRPYSATTVRYLMAKNKRDSWDVNLNIGRLSAEQGQARNEICNLKNPRRLVTDVKNTFRVSASFGRLRKIAGILKIRAMLVKKVYADTMAGPCTSSFWRWIVLVMMATTTTVTGQACPIADYVSVDGVCYKDFAEKKTYDAARQTCAADGGLLAMPKDNTANSAVYNLVGAGKRWIGLTDIDIEGQWLFEDGQTLASAGYSDWNIDEPNDAGVGEDCLEVDVDSRSWNDNNCGSGFGFVCQLGGSTMVGIWLLVSTTRRPFECMSAVFGVALRSRLTSDDAGMSHLSVSWATGIIPISGYTLRYQPADGSGSPQDLSPAPGVGATSAIVSGLLADTEYTLTLTSFGDDGQPNGVISGTFTTDPVVVNVQCTQDSMSLSIPRAALPAVNVENLHLLDPDCGATEDEDEDVFELETHLQECGTLQETSGEDKVIFSNVVIANQVTYENGAVRNQPVNLPFQCEFLRQYGVSQGGDIMFNIPPPRVDVVHADNTFTLEMQIFTSTDFSTEYKSSEFPIKVKPSDRLNFGLSVVSPLDNLELFARYCVSTPTTSPDHSTRVNIIDDGCQVDQTLQKDPDLSNDKAQYYSVSAFTFPNALDSSLVYFHCTMIICFKDDPDSRCKQGCIPPARRRRAVSGGTEGRVRRESSRDQAVDITRGPFQVKQEAGAGPAVVPLGTAVGASVGVAGIMALLILAVVLVRKRRGQASENMKRDDNTVGMDNYAFQVWGKTDKTGAADTKA